MNDPMLGRANVPKEELRCDFCQLPFPDLEQETVFGCARCYQAFFDEWQNNFGKTQKGSVHKGKVPAHWVKKRVIEHELRKIKQEYLGCLAEENYEKAEQLKKMISKLGASIPR